MHKFTGEVWKSERIGGNPGLGPHTPRENGMAFRVISDAYASERREIAILYYKPNIEEAHANARLIESAPEMYRQLKSAVEQWSRYEARHNDDTGQYLECPSAELQHAQAFLNELEESI